MRLVTGFTATATAEPVTPGGVRKLAVIGLVSLNARITAIWLVALELTAPGRAPLVLETVGEDGVLGWSWLVPPYKWFCDARAVEPTDVVVLDGACLRGKCDADPALGYALLTRVSQVMHERLQATRVRLLDLYGGPGAHL